MSIPVVFGANNTHLLYRFILLFLLISCPLQTQDLGNAVTTHVLLKNHSLLLLMISLFLRTQQGTTALLLAGWEGHSEVVKLLLGAGARDIPNKVPTVSMATI